MATGEGTKRLAALDVLRGFVIALMTVDHASEKLNAGRVMMDGAFMWRAGTPLPPVQFLTRWITHLCAPTFVLLAGVALAMSAEKRRARGESDASIGRHILVRGVLLMVFEVVWMSPVMVGPGRVLFQVLYALGGSLVCMSVLRRLPDRALLALGVGLALGSEAINGLLMWAGVARSIPAAVLFTGGFYFDRKWIIAYPLVPWLSVMCIGWSLGRRLLVWTAEEASRFFVRAGALGLASFLVLRGIDGYGNMALHREGMDVVQWLHVSKYPPSVTFLGLELGITSLLLGFLLRHGSRVLAPLESLGKVSLFYYLLHIHVLALVATVFGVEHKLGVASAWVGAAAVLVVLYPVTQAYARYKQANPNGLARYV